MKKFFAHPETGKPWWVEVKKGVVYSCLNNGKVLEVIDDSFTKNKHILLSMAKMRKGFIYQDPTATLGKPMLHICLDRTHSGFQPIAISPDGGEFYAVHTIGEFEDEVVYHCGADAQFLGKQSLGAQRLSYTAVCADDNSLFLNNQENIERFKFGMEQQETIAVADKNRFDMTMLDAKKNMVMWCIQNEIVVRTAKEGVELFRKKVEFRKEEMPGPSYWPKSVGMLSPQATKLLYMVNKIGYWLVDLKTGRETFLKAPYGTSIFSPDDQYLVIGNHFFDTESGQRITHNPLPFSVPDEFESRCACTFDGLIAIKLDLHDPVDIWDYASKKRLCSIKDEFTGRFANYALAKEKLIVSTDYGILSAYSLSSLGEKRSSRQKFSEYFSKTKRD